MRYSAPSPEDFQRLKDDRRKTGNEMAGLFGVVSGQQWCKYTGGVQRREMAPQILFLGAARLALTQEEFERVVSKMRELGADIELD
ncbi:hypothetical protein [Paraburkholderia susongensis]|uniref:Uncharacterized protein n=1 Tax=Paraburkholderia susongensis TaxID=1515439 RepID=A0A1X7JCL6_9BURK|nr:hypothetical protein [Paraburkholderia susongensis]SMG25663.1 hypothetical protein SAMN06265784_102455 [Paraburkholderia susongensis]